MAVASVSLQRPALFFLILVGARCLPVLLAILLRHLTALSKIQFEGGLPLLNPLPEAAFYESFPTGLKSQELQRYKVGCS